MLDSEISGLRGEERLEGVEILRRPSGEPRTPPVTWPFEAIGHDARSSRFADQLELDEVGGVRVAHPSIRTSRPGVVACGDLVDRRCRPPITAAGSGSAAGLDQARADRAAFSAVDIEEAPRAAERFQVTSVPTVIIVKDGEVVHRMSGATPRAVLRAELEPHLSAPHLP